MIIEQLPWSLVLSKPMPEYLPDIVFCISLSDRFEHIYFLEKMTNITISFVIPLSEAFLAFHISQTENATTTMGEIYIWI